MAKCLDIIITIFGTVMVAYHIIATLFMPLEPVYHLNTHLLFALILVFLNFIKKGGINVAIGLILILLSVTALVYVYVNAVRLEMYIGQVGALDLAIGIMIVLVVLIASKIVAGIALPAIAVLFIIYSFLGHHIPGVLYHPPISTERIISWLSIGLTTAGVYGPVLYVSANVIFLFILFGSFLEVTHTDKFFMEFGGLVGRKIQGGAAQTSIVSSALVGSITGSPVANIALTGSVTIPLMKKIGFRPDMAAAVEATASSGGMLLPPVMGAAGFLMAGLTGIPYIKIIKMAIIPAILYYLSVGLSVYIYARKEQIPHGDAEIDIALMLKRSVLFVVPFSTIVVLMVLGYSPQYAAAWSILLVLLFGYMGKETRPSFIDLAKGLAKGATIASTVAVLCALLGMITSVISLTGLAFKVTNIVEMLSHGILPIALLVTMAVSLFLGMVAPVMGAYVMVAVIVTPLLMKLGMSLEQAHFFALYFSVIGFLTPPVAPSAIVAAQMANGSLMKTSLRACKLCASGFLIPFLFSYDSALLGQFNKGAASGLLSLLIVIIVVASLSFFLSDYCLVKLGPTERALTAVSVAGALLYYFKNGYMPGVIICLSAFLLMIFLQLIKNSKKDLRLK